MNQGKILRISIVGTGNVATHLAQTIAKSQHELVYIVSRDLSRAQLIADKTSAKATTDIKKLETSSDLIIIAIKDEALTTDYLKSFPKGIILCHTSGTISMEVFSAHERYGIFYPLQTFSKQKEVDFNEVPICLEANSDEVMQSLELLAYSTSNRVYEINSTQRKALHLAAVFACNFTNLMYSISEELCLASGLDFEILRPLISETAQKVQDHSPREVQTGPAVRKDKKVIYDHLKLLAKHKNYQDIYKKLTDEIIKINEEL